MSSTRCSTRGLQRFQVHYQAKLVSVCKSLDGTESVSGGSAECAALAGKFTSCEGKALLNNFNRNGWPNGTLQTGDYSFLNDFINRGWYALLLATSAGTPQCLCRTIHRVGPTRRFSRLDLCRSSLRICSGLQPGVEKFC